MCEYCDGSKKPIETEVDGDAYMTVTPDDAEYPEGFLLDFYSEPNEGGIWYSFIVPRCPMCGRGAPRKGVPIDELDLSVRTYNCLRRAHVDTVDDLCAMTEEELREVHGVRERCVDEVRMRLGGIGRGLRGDAE